MLVTRVTESGLTSYVTGQEIAALDKDPLKGRVHTSRRSVADRFFFFWRGRTGNGSQRMRKESLKGLTPEDNLSICPTRAYGCPPRPPFRTL